MKRKKEPIFINILHIQSSESVVFYFYHASGTKLRTDRVTVDFLREQFFTAPLWWLQACDLIFLGLNFLFCETKPI